MTYADVRFFTKRIFSIFANYQFLRFVLNGICATAVHYAVLRYLVDIQHFRFLGLANGLAALFGVATSYLGNKIFVFRSQAATKRTLPRFAALYSLVAAWHMLALFVWSDYFLLSYHSGYVLATIASIALTFILNRFYVFR